MEHALFPVNPIAATLRLSGNIEFIYFYSSTATAETSTVIGD
jgi:hypothetical protein